ncbi:LysM peptidoglycan-binding domain-containing protein [Psychromicrobium xiongbiense]|uniref:LysM peptidoglycan-binding domain-containing protein n=1 Tax=Psychromicrobium xiongbiense TaxID=3051184 RepID=UPI0025548D6B|nr:LysM peptidoglycan-binding domain-containing protein [Psychromicrobium sp. YIM S02556]
MSTLHVATAAFAPSRRAVVPMAISASRIRRAPGATSRGVAFQNAEPGSALHLTRRGRMVLIGVPLMLLAVAVLVLIGSFVGQVKASDAAVSGVQATSVTVQPGDSIWSLAAHSGVNRDQGDLVTEIIELNGLTSSVLQPGQSLLVPTR